MSCSTKEPGPGWESLTTLSAYGTQGPEPQASVTRTVLQTNVNQVFKTQMPAQISSGLGDMVVTAVGTCLHQVCTWLCAPRATTLLLHGLGLCATTSSPPKSPNPAQAAREHPCVHPGPFCPWALR